MNSQALGLLSELLCDILAQLLSGDCFGQMMGRKQYIPANYALSLIVCFTLYGFVSYREVS